MKRFLTLFFAFGLLLGSLATTSSFAQSRRRDDTLQSDEPATNSKLNNRRLEKNMDKYADQLQLSKRQQKQLKKIDRRYARMERKMNRRGGGHRGDGRRGDRRRDRRQLAEEKRLEVIEVLTPDQQQTLEALSKKGRFSFDQLFGR
jgi:Spy/CpxP family protein refolding chaperone